MYGRMPSAKIDMRSSAPPENMLNMPRMPPALLLEDLRHHHRVDARQRDVGAEAIDDQAAEREPEPLLELGRLAEDAEIDVGGELLG